MDFLWSLLAHFRTTEVTIWARDLKNICSWAKDLYKVSLSKFSKSQLFCLITEINLNVVVLALDRDFCTNPF